MDRLESMPVTRIRRPCRKPISRSFPVELKTMDDDGGVEVYRIKRLARSVAAFLLAACAVAAAGAEQQRVLRVAYLIAETNFDPAFTSDLYSNNIIEEIFEAPLTYDFLARPVKLKPQTLEAMPEVTDGGKTYTLKLRKGIFFSDDPAFGGKKRELTAVDYDFAFKRLMDPKVSSPNLWLIGGRGAGIEEA